MIGFLFAVIPQDMRPALTGDDDVFPAIAIEVDNADLQANTGAIFDDGKLLELLPCLVPLEVGM